MHEYMATALHEWKAVDARPYMAGVAWEWCMDTRMHIAIAGSGGHTNTAAIVTVDARIHMALGAVDARIHGHCIACMVDARPYMAIVGGGAWTHEYI